MKPLISNGLESPEVERLRDKVGKCRELALLCGDVEIERRLVALANEFEVKAVRAGVRANFKRGRFAQIADDADERRKLALTNFSNSW